MKIRTVGELKKAIKKLDDSTLVMIGMDAKADVIMGVHKQRIAGMDAIVLANTKADEEEETDGEDEDGDDE